MSGKNKAAAAKDAPASIKSVPASKRKLGRGLGALLGEVRQEEPLTPAPQSGLHGKEERGSAGSTVSNPVERPAGLTNLPVASIEPHPQQPRTHFDEEALEELAASIAQRGVIQPVIVRRLDNGRYQLVAGERRWRAAQKAQLHEIPALIRDLEEREVMALALIENIQRENLSPVEEARAYQRLADQEKMTQAEISRLVEKSRSHVANLQRLLALPEEVLAHIEAGQLDMGHARALIGQENAAELAKKAIEKKLSVREVEKLVRKQAREASGDAPAKRHARKPRAEDADIIAVQKQLEEFLGLPVKIESDDDPRSGTVAIKYRTLDQLDLICQRLSGGDI
ncbi:ParB/RepB/Spo0J family partition protein [Altericroceibacterium spongiae]|uniref:ParB/RepB/Spo0J family partition protein n=1 Tax=Altericroceibacterium spongiae TaxID=2320269 RepID=A0A420EEG8_9SPHN|nr:ParB/RepB/Spo0J family partition protein [Altericroceibacterium spongiae]RKF19058.1 ParB/RepB/Spo0J family partition protein [Altericroceibacterium spongiae]